MKKLSCLLLCLIVSCLFLVGCGEQEIGSQLKDYPKFDNKIDEVALNLYIIVEDETVSDEKTKAINTVNNAIKQYTSSKFHSEVNVVYVTASEYQNTAINAINANDSTAANIVLVAGKDMYDSFFATGKLVNLNPYLDTKAFGRLNTEIPTTLINAATVSGKATDGSDIKNLYVIPNNHVIGNYEYLIINKALARDVYNISESKCKSFKSLDEAQALIDAVTAAGVHNVSDVIWTEKGAYEDKAVFESQGYYCNVIKNPVADADVAFASAFAIIDRGELANERAMEIIYNINVDVELRNLLQYGVRGTNYNAEFDYDYYGQEINDSIRVIRDTSVNNLYYMNVLYTGNVFKAYDCEEISLDKTFKENGIKQNLDSINE